MKQVQLRIPVSHSAVSWLIIRKVTQRGEIQWLSHSSRTTKTQSLIKGHKALTFLKEALTLIYPKRPFLRTIRDMDSLLYMYPATLYLQVVLLGIRVHLPSAQRLHWETTITSKVKRLITSDPHTILPWSLGSKWSESCSKNSTCQIQTTKCSMMTLKASSKSKYFTTR